MDEVLQHAMEPVLRDLRSVRLVAPRTASTSTLNVLWVLYDRILRVAPGRLLDPDRDRFLLSKGHGPSAYYVVLAATGFIPVSWLPSFGDFDSPLGYHPDRNLVPGVEIPSGSLGHGLPLAVGVALGLRAQGIKSRVVVLVGDAELDEGSNAEAVEFAAAAGLFALTVVAVDNASATWGWRGGGWTPDSPPPVGAPRVRTVETMLPWRRRWPSAATPTDPTSSSLR